MLWTTPSALVGLIAAAAPLTIYLLLRRRKTEVPWGASYLLRLTLASKKKSSVWLQYLVLALRTLVLALVALAIAGPRQPQSVSASAAPEPPAAPLHRVVLVDDSLSMTVGDGAGTRIGRQRVALLALGAALRPGDRIDLISLVDPMRPLAPPRGGGAAGAPDVDEAARFDATVDALSPREGALQLHAALAAALQTLAGSPEAAAELYILSDFPREILADVGRLSWFGPVAEARGIRVVPVAMTAPTEAAPVSVALVDAALGTDSALQGLPTTLYLTLANHSATETTAQLRITGDHLAETTQAVTLQANETRRTPVVLRFPEPGVETLHIQVRPSLLQAAGERWLSVDVRPTLSVWLVADIAAPGRGALGEGEFIRRAVGPESGAPMRLEEVPVTQLSAGVPDTVDVVLLAGPRVVTPSVAEPLARFVRRGGGLIVAGSDSLDATFYNEALAELLPARIAAPAWDAMDPERHLGIKPLTGETASLLFAELATPEAGDLAAPRIYNYLTLESFAADTRHLFTLDNGDPLLLERPFGRGRVLLFTASLGISWSSLPVHQSYLPFLVRLLQASAAGRGFPRNLAPGTPFVQAWPPVVASDDAASEPAGPEAASATSSVALTRPGEREATSVALSVAVGGAFVVLPGAETRGVYQLADRDGNATTFTVRGLPAEADLRSLDADGRTALEASLAAPLYPDWAAAVAALGPAGASRPLWPWLLLALLALYLVETYLVRRL